MLCPKCGRISFDNLTSCSKCQHDLSTIQAQLRGTAIQAERCFFLASTLSAGDAADHVDDINLADIATSETPTADNIPAQEEAPAELADAAVVVPQAQQDTGSAEPQPGKTGIEPLESLGKKAQTTPENEPTPTGNMTAPPATEPLILAINDDEPDNQNESRDNGQIPIDLAQIDLSDLLHPPQQTPQDTPSVAKPAGHQDHQDDDLPDLSIESSAGTTSPEFDFDDLTLEKGLPANERGNKPVDLSLEMDKTNSPSGNLEPIDLTLESD